MCFERQKRGWDEGPSEKRTKFWASFRELMDGVMGEETEQHSITREVKPVIWSGVNGSRSVIWAGAAPIGVNGRFMKSGIGRGQKVVGVRSKGDIGDFVST
jgi:hypothetical protein